MMASEQSGEPKVESEVGSRSSPDQMRREIEEEFNVQRAKMKDLFLQKEDELRKLQQEKEQLCSEVVSLRAELQQLQTLSHNQTSEIQSLQLLVSETVEASSSGSEEARRMRGVIMELNQQLAQARQQLQQQEVSLAPATLVRNIARKLGADAEPEQQIKKAGIPAEDSELYRSVVEPLEMEITALKNKLRETDTQLQDALKGKTAAAVAGGDSRSEPEGESRSSRACDMCANYEAQLVAAQQLAERNKDAAHRATHALRLATEELEGARSLHDETVTAWRADRAAAAAQLTELRANTQAAMTALADVTKHSEEAAKRTLEKVTELTVDRELLQKKLDTLERDNAMLMGQFTKKAIEMQNEVIDLPSDVEELQELCLRTHEALISCAVGREAALSSERHLRAALQAQAGKMDEAERRCRELSEELGRTRSQLEELQTEQAHMQELGEKLRQSGDMIESLLEDKKRLQSEKQELRSQVSSLQHELDTSEKVQQDFVRLSQSLQMELQRLREADTEVRWQHEDDVAACGACRAPLPHARLKRHCRHCGRIYCAACLSELPCGARQRPAKVCGPCATLLRPHHAPYFHTNPPP